MYVYRRSLLGSELWAESEDSPCCSGLSGARPPKAQRSPGTITLPGQRRPGRIYRSTLEGGAA